MRKSAGWMPFISVVVLASLWSHSACGQVPLVLNELMASNGSTLADPQGQYDDWIEIYNGSRSPFNAGGLYLSDDPATPQRWRIPTNAPGLTTVPAGGFLLIWADGRTTDSGLHASFSLDADGDALYLYDADGVTLIDSIAFGNQISDVSFGRYPDATGDWRFLTIPTPGMSNVEPAMGVVSNLRFSHERGFYDTAFDLTLACKTPGAEIYYTTDGSRPYLLSGRRPTGTLYTRPIRITRTTCLRAIAVLQDWVPSPVQTQTYIFPANVAQQPALPAGFPSTWGARSADYQMAPAILSNPQYGSQLQAALMSLPSMSIVMTNQDLFDPQTGIYANSGNSGINWERPASIELIHPDGTEGFQTDCGVRIQGGYFRQPSAGKKHSFRLLFKGIYGPTKLRYPLFGDDAAQEFDTITLRAGANDGYIWGGNESNVQYTRDQFMRDFQLGTGNAASHGNFVHLYVNGLYWGLYNPCERPDGSFSSSYYGGLKEDWDVMRHKSFTVDQGDRTALNQMLSLCQEAGRSYEALMRLQGKGLDGRRRAEYPCLLDLPNYVDYILVNVWGGNWDWPWNNYWLGRDRTAASTGFKFYCWDAEDVMLTSRSPLNFNMLTAGNFSSEVGQPHARLKENPEYRLFFADRVHRLFFNRGILTTNSLIARYAQLAGGIEQAIIPEAARWADQNGSNVTPAHWISMRDRILTTYLPQRTGIVLGQLRAAGLYPSIDAPVFHVDGTPQHGGPVASSHRLTMEGGNVVYYTLDGSDPRIAGSAGGTIVGKTILEENAPKKALVPTATISDAWKGGAAFDDSAWIRGAGGVGYELESGFEAYIGIDLADQMYQRNSSCYIRIPFNVASDDHASFSGLSLNVRCDDGFVAYLNGTEIARKNVTGAPAWNSATGTSVSDSAAVVFELFDVTTHLSKLRSGDNLLAVQAMNSSSASRDLLFSAQLVASKTLGGNDPVGVSLTALRYSGPITLDKTTRVKARTLGGTTWSALNEAVFAVGPVAQSLRISEIHYHPAGDPNAEFIELTNVGSQNLNLNLVRFARGITFTFPPFDLPAEGYCLLVKDLTAFEAVYGNKLPVVGQYTGSLDNAGEKLELLDAVGQVIQSFEYKDNWFDLTDGLGFSLTMRDPRTGDPGNKSAWRPSALAGGSPGTDDNGLVPEPGSVVINEILSNPSGGSDWIELYNTTDRSIDLGGWFLSDDGNDLTKYRIAQGTSIPAKGYIVFTQDQHFGNSADPGSRKSFGLAKDGETVYLHSGLDGILTGYSEKEKFDASEPGVSLGRWQKSTGTYNFVALAEPTPGQANAAPLVGPVVITEIMYHPADQPDAEYVELLNIGDAAVTLYDAEKQLPWRFTDDPQDPAIELLFPSDPPVTLAPGQYLILAKDLSLLNSRYSVPASVKVLAWDIGRLTNGSERIQLSRPFNVDDEGKIEWIRVDRISYSDGSHPQDFATGVDPWPVEADGQGKSLHRIDPHAYGNDPENWRAAIPSPGRASP